MYQITKSETQTSDSKTKIHVSNSTSVESSNSVRRPKSKGTKLKNKVLKNTKSSSAYVQKISRSVSIDSNKRETKDSNVCQTNESVSNSKTVNDVNDGSNIVCVSCGKDVFLHSHEKCVTLYALSRKSNVKRALFTTPVAAKFKNLGTTFVVAKFRLSVANTPKATNKIVNSECLKCMTGNLQMLRNFVEKFMGTVYFGNDHFAAITEYGDYVQGNLTICHVYYVEGLGHILFLGCSENPPAQNQPFPSYSSQYASMTLEQFQQHEQEQQQAFFRWQQSQVLNREFQDLQQNPPSFNSETFQSLTQPQQVDSPKKDGRKKTKSKRGKHVEDKPQEPVAAGCWLPVEEELLATCYVAISEDNNVGRSQKHETFWYRVLNEFNLKNFQKRTKDMLTSKWHTLNANCQKFNAAYKRAKRLGKSGENDPKWDAPEQVDLTGDVLGATQEDLFGHDARLRPTGKPRPAKKAKFDATASTGGSSASTQFGELMEQELRLKREAAERAFEAQAEKDRTLMRLEELRFLATSTKDLDDDDAYWIKK
nr:integrase, catalytic region, zinc finger, CCHC-type, peptidase aspartic, catalytic [Tanacetum cinerariifolium]